VSKFEVVDQVHGFGFPEALRWREGKLWFSDMFRGQVMSWQPGGEPEVVLSSKTGGPKMPGGLGWTSSGELLIVDCLERTVIKVGSDGEPKLYLDLTAFTDHPLNDMHVDTDGTAWVGGYGFDPETQKPKASPIFRYTEQGEFSKSSARYVFPNGCERRGEELVVAETFSDQVSFFNNDFEHLQSFKCSTGSGPDGLTFDPEGALYVAMAFTGRIERLGVGGEFELAYALESSQEHMGGPKGIFDCAMHPTNGTLAFSSACLDEGYSMKNDTGSITLLGR